MSGSLHLTIATPGTAVVDSDDVRAVRASDESGSFGILPGHADLLTVLPASIVRWRDADGETHYCAVRGGVLSLTGGHRLAIACRRAMLGNRLEELEDRIVSAGAAEEDEDRKARTAQAQLHARAIRQLMHYLLPGGEPADVRGIFPDGTQ
ncbi:F0F1 ATP synthase subunit epsilon [Novosphingobium sp. PC22D]|uniref:F0F1 ATP synthase subunit epsilon n=1 Tax=Novosphingobium sp. PC22D TaxID=1962403 RepID=UPI000BF2274C|nr:F0F1 ATP synthase subunit epsilon [Novosphingobium sp. PC22D]PEQ11597.1 F0F1 ATP synthase subunit epsilon [Novosphingobium sp. PC22D]